MHYITLNSLFCIVKHSINIATIFPKHLFWDMDYSKLNLSKDKSIIIPRAFFATTPETFETDIQKLEELKGQKKVEEAERGKFKIVPKFLCMPDTRRHNMRNFMYCDKHKCI